MTEANALAYFDVVVTVEATKKKMCTQGVIVMIYSLCY